MWLLLALHAVFASTYTLGKMALYYAEPVFLIAIRMLVSAAFLFGILVFFRKSFFVKKRDIGLFLSMSFFLIYLSYVPEFIYLKYISTTKWALIFTLTPFTTALIGFLMGREPKNRAKFIGLTIGFIGIIPALMAHDNGESWSEIFYVSFPELVFIGCMVSYSFGWILSKMLVVERSYNPLFVNAFAMFFGGVGAAITSPFVDNWSPAPVTASGPFLLVLTLLVLASTAAFGLNTYLLHYYSATFLLFLMFVDPLYTALYAKLFLNEPLAPHFFVSVLLVFIGLYIFYREELKEGYKARGIS